MFNQQIHFKITYWLLIAAMITTPFTIYFMLPIAILLFVNFIAEWNWKIRWNRIRENEMSRFFWIFISIYILYLFGMTYTQNFSYGMSNLENKIWFLIAPFLIFTMSQEQFTWKLRNRLIFIFIISTFAVSLINMGISLIEYLEFKNPFLFFYEKASHIPFENPMHPTYLSMYITFAFIAALYYIYFSPIDLKKWKKIVLGTSLPFLFIFNYLLQSKAGLIVFFVMVLISTLYLMNRIKVQLLKSGLFVVLLFSFVFVTLRYGSETMNRMAAAVRDISNKNSNDDGAWRESESASQRLVVWRIAAEQSVKNLPFGVGTGDAKDTMVNQYKVQGYHKLYHDQLNPHNQYLHTFLALGILGLAALITYFAFPFIKSWKEKKLLYLAFMCIVMPNLLTESMLERGAGANFIALLMCILAYDAFAIDKGQKTKD